MVVLIFAYKIYPDFIEPSMSYSHAKKMLSEKKYDDAVAEFEKLGSYKDAEDMVLRAKYNYAKQLVSNKKYDDAISIFEELDDYKDSKDMVKKSTYEKANDLLKNGDYEKARDIFEALNDQKMIADTICQEVSNLITEKKYEKAGNVLRWCPYSIKRNNDNLKELSYQLADAYMNEEEYQSASGIFKDISDYKDSLSKWGKCQIQLGKYYMSKKQKTEATRRFERVLKEDTTPENIKEAKSQLKKCEEEAKIENIFMNIEFGVSPEKIEEQFGEPDEMTSPQEVNDSEQYIYTYKEYCTVNGTIGDLEFIFENSDKKGNRELSCVWWDAINDNFLTKNDYEKLIQSLEKIWGKSARGQMNPDHGHYYMIRNSWNDKECGTTIYYDSEKMIIKSLALSSNDV